MFVRKLLVALVLLASATWAQAQLVVVVNAKSATSSMTAEQVSAIFMGKSNALPSGATAQPVDQAEGGALREHFYAKVAGKQAAQVKAAWSRLVFSGKATPPKELTSSAEVKKFVASNADGIGYIEKSAADSSVKVVLAVD